MLWFVTTVRQRFFNAPLVFLNAIKKLGNFWSQHFSTRWIWQSNCEGLRVVNSLDMGKSKVCDCALDRDCGIFFSFLLFFLSFFFLFFSFFNLWICLFRSTFIGFDWASQRLWENRDCFSTKLNLFFFFFFYFLTICVIRSHLAS
jgi:hypothetical protein